ncbi:hypothetical protein CCMA1212_000590 [Trichoderma ghanense]|uniref:Uncharacterized protein n=1 Tax=Trichoderma ghanense TaxID=65468 RepID=A0ABY2HH76_9HYPO
MHAKWEAGNVAALALSRRHHRVFANAWPSGSVAAAPGNPPGRFEAAQPQSSTFRDFKTGGSEEEEREGH